MLPEPDKQVRVVEQHEFDKLLAVCENPALRALLAVAHRQAVGQPLGGSSC